MHERLVNVGQTGVRVCRLGGTRSGEIRISRFLRNAKVCVDEMISHSSTLTASRVRGRRILAIQDTTSLRDDGKGLSIVAHPTIAVDRDNGALLGLVHAGLLERKGGEKALRAQRVIADKQSYRWLEGAEHAAGLVAAGARCVTVIGDAESDIYEMFSDKPEGVELLLRSRHNRKLEDGSLLADRVAALDEAGRMAVSLPASPGRRAREIEALRALLRRPVQAARQQARSGKASAAGGCLCR